MIFLIWTCVAQVFSLVGSVKIISKLSIFFTGEHIIVFHELYFKLKKDYSSSTLCHLSSNIVTHFELSKSGALSKCHSPLKIIELKASKDFSNVIQLDKSQHIVHNQNEIMCWLQTAEGTTRIEAELYIRISHKRKWAYKLLTKVH